MTWIRTPRPNSSWPQLSAPLRRDLRFELFFNLVKPGGDMIRTTSTNKVYPRKVEYRKKLEQRVLRLNSQRRTERLRFLVNSSNAATWIAWGALGSFACSPTERCRTSVDLLTRPPSATQHTFQHMERLLTVCLSGVDNRVWRRSFSNRIANWLM